MLTHDGADLRRSDLLEEFQELPISATKYEHFVKVAQAFIDHCGYGYIQAYDGKTYNRIHSRTATGTRR